MVRARRSPLSEKATLLRINVGCGRTPIPGWLNVDNSLSVLLARMDLLCWLLDWLKLLDESQMAFIRVARDSGIVWGSALRLPVPDESAEVVYASHMLEHLDRREAWLFLQEAKRVLVKGGWLRLVVPDLKKLVIEYLRDGDADKFVASTLLPHPRVRGLFGRIKYVIVGDRHHLWMYDSGSLERLLREAGFREGYILEPGESNIPNPGLLNLRERAEESIFAEARK